MSYRKPFGAGRLEATAEVLLHLPRLGLVIYLDAFSDVILEDSGLEVGSRGEGGGGRGRRRKIGDGG